MKKLKNKIYLFYFSFLNVWCLLKLLISEDYILIRWPSYFFDFIFVSSLFFLIFSIKFISKIYLLFIILPFLVFIDGNKFKVDSVNEKSIKILTYSVMGRNMDYDPIIDAIKSEEPDIIFLQEVNFPNKINTEWLNDNYLFRSERLESGLIILSKFEIISHDYFQNALKSTVLIDGKLVDLFNIHSIRSIFNYERYKKYTDSLLINFINASEIAIVAGDFNMVPHNDFYKKITEYYKDTCTGICGYTFPASGRKIGAFAPFLRIDYIFSRGTRCAYGSKVLIEKTSSDHYPIVSNVCV
ncbi:endonuclease/exonuclease/phosphatase family protein [Pseudoalteromonas neustonica]|uniref:Endonuclease/exonuclease/phosphatase family protein n=1 Tax=Pseudoalteromonas neustonica TaxID=1840331 RepID=A0ABU9U0C4_9GAMM